MKSAIDSLNHVFTWKCWLRYWYWPNKITSKESEKNLGWANDDTEKYRSEFEYLFYKNLKKCEKWLRVSSERILSATFGVTSNATAFNSNILTPMQSVIK